MRQCPLGAKVFCRAFFQKSAFFLLLPSLAYSDPQSDAQRALNQHLHAERLARTHERADAARAALLAEQQVQAAAALRRLENQTGGDTVQLAQLEAQQAAASQRLGPAQAALERLLPVMQRLSAEPAATLLAAPLSAADAVRGVTIVQGIANAIESQAAEVKAQSAQMLVLLAQARAAQTRLNGAVAAQQTAEAALTRQIAAAKAAEMADADAVAQEHAATLAAQRKLDSIAAAVKSLVPAATVAANLPAASGGAPVAGYVSQRFGAATIAGPAQGISYSAAPGARVTTPCAGTVMFAGAFPAYGEMVIADCGGGSSVVLAGMNRLDVSAGQRLAHGQPVGSMLGYDPANPTRQPVLYVELRQNGAPVDPTLWLAGGGSG